MPRHPDPWVFHAHPITLAVVAALAVLWVLIVRRWAAPTGRQWWAAAGALVALLAAVWWPVADVAARWSLTALVVQRLLLTLAVAPLALVATPAKALAGLTRPRAVDAAVEAVTRPPVAVALFTAVAVGTLVPPAVQAQATSVAARAGLDAVLLVGGLVLWGPVVRHLPGASRVGSLGTAVYLFVQSLVPTFLAVVFVFARHPFYPVYAHAAGAIGISPLADQQIAGIVGKVGTLPVLWTVAWREIGRARRLEEAGSDPRPMLWLDVERRLQRAERRPEKPRRARPERPAWRPELTTRFPTVEPPRPGDSGGTGAGPAGGSGSGPATPT